MVLVKEINQNNGNFDQFEFIVGIIPNLSALSIFCSLLKFKPLQLGYFYSAKINEYVKNNHQNYDLIFFQSFIIAYPIP